MSVYKLLIRNISLACVIASHATAQDVEWQLTNSYVGVGTGSPESKLHVQGTTDTKLLVENTDSASNAAQVMFELKNGGPGKIRFSITNNGSNTWTFDNNFYNDWFSISKIGTQVDEFVVKSNGDGVFRGSSYAVNHVNTSSRNMKTDFAEIDSREILERLASLPVSEWRYKSENELQRHIGPVAEDFQAAFDLGDGRTISTVDASGVAIAAIQGLLHQLKKRDQVIDELKSKLELQSQQMARIEAALESLSAGSPVAAE